MIVMVNQDDFKDKKHKEVKVALPAAKAQPHHTVKVKLVL